jgi:Ca2+-binding EF-hand superfamily protein
MCNFEKGDLLRPLGLVIGFFLIFNAHAEQAASRGPAEFSDFDRDSSGFVSEEEFDHLEAQRMSENAAAGRKMKGAATAPTFSDIDTNQDGKLSPEELTTDQVAHREKRHELSEGQGKGHGKGNGQGNGKGYGKGQGAAESKSHAGKKGNKPAFSEFDLDGNGSVDETEFNQAHAERISKMAAEGRQMKHVGDAPGFSGIDSNDDDLISKDEFDAHQAQHHKQKHADKNASVK